MAINHPIFLVLNIDLQIVPKLVCQDFSYPEWLPLDDHSRMLGEVRPLWRIEHPELPGGGGGAPAGLVPALARVVPVEGPPHVDLGQNPVGLTFNEDLWY